MNKSYKIAITGMGIITPAGNGLLAFANDLFSGTHQFQPIQGFDASSHRTQMGAEIKTCSYKPTHLNRSHLARTDLFGLDAAHQALDDAGLLADNGQCLDEHIGIVCGTAGGAITGLEHFFHKRFHGVVCDAKPLLNSFCLSALATNLAKEFQIKGPRTTLATVCSSSGLALARGFEMLLSDESVDHVLVVSSESLSEVTHGGFNALRSIAPERCQPFDANRKGLILGEAGCAMVLSRTQKSKYGYLAGYGLTTDLYHFTAPDPEGSAIASAMNKGLQHAGLKSAEVDYINCHGTATLKNDAAEAAGILVVFDQHHPPVSSTKSMFGHTLGSASLLETIGTLLGMERQLAPPTANITELDDFDLDVIVHKSRPWTMSTCLSNSFAFGGSDISLVLTKDDAQAHDFKSKTIKAVITGIGVVSPLGVGCDDFVTTLASGTSGLQSMSCFDASCSMDGGLVDMQEVRAHIPLKRRRRLNRLGSFLTVAVDEALKRAGLADNVNGFGMVYGSAFGCSSNVHAFYSKILEGGAATASPQEFMFSVTNAPAALVAQHLQIPGEVWVLVQDEVSWEAVLHYGAELIETGKEKRVIVAAADELSDSILAIHESLGFFQHDYVLGEGCIAMILEAEPDAVARKASILGSITAYNMTHDVRCDPMGFSESAEGDEPFHARIGQSGVVGGITLAAQLLTGHKDEITVTTNSRGGIIATTSVVRTHG